MAMIEQDTTNEQLNAVSLGKTSNLKRRICHARIQAQGRRNLGTSLHNLRIPDNLKQTIRGEDFLLHDTEDGDERMIIFAARSDLDVRKDFDFNHVYPIQINYVINLCRSCHTAKCGPLTGPSNQDLKCSSSCTQFTECIMTLFQCLSCMHFFLESPSTFTRSSLSLSVGALMGSQRSS